MDNDQVIVQNIRRGMSTARRVNTAPPDSFDPIRYLYGDCAILAYAIHAQTGWPLMQIMEGFDDRNPEWYGRHALVQMPDGRLLDAAGAHSDLFAEPLDRGAWHSDNPRIVARSQQAGVMADAEWLIGNADWTA